MADLLAGIPDVPVALAAPELVRRRGEQRRTRARLVAGGVAALLLATVTGTAVALGDRPGRPDSLQVTTTPAAAAAPSLAGALLQPSDLTAARGGTWAQDGPWLDEPTAFVEVCADSTSVRGVEGLAAVLVDGHGGRSDTHVLRMADREAAAGGLSTLRQEAARCPATPAGPAVGSHGEDGPSEATVTELGIGAVGLQVTKVLCGEECRPTTERWAVIAEGSLLSFTQARSQDELSRLLPLVRARLAACSTTCPPPEQDHPRGYADDAVPHVGDELWAVTIGGVLPDEPASDDTAAARRRARLAGYAATTVTARCAPGSIEPGATLPESATLVQLYFRTQDGAAAFREAYRSFSGGPASQPHRVTIRCLDR